jgi:hypothetical protein
MRMACTDRPGCVTLVFRGLPTVWRGRHRLLLCWLVFLPAVHPGRKTWAELARWTPAASTAWRFGRLRKAPSGHGPLLVSWLAQARVATWPPPAHGILPLCGDGRQADPRGPNHPVGQKGRLSQPQPWFLGLRCVGWRAAWEGDRLPGSWRRMLPTGPAA